MADEIEIVASDPFWPRAYAEEARALTAALTEPAALSIHHVGSTAVPGLAAKPVIDIAVETSDLEAARSAYPDRLAPLGYVFWADNPDRSRLFFVKGMPPHGRRRTHHVHVYPRGHEKLADQIAFRDALRRDRDAAARYAELKHRLAETHRDDREAYTDAKAVFVREILSG